MSVGPDSLDILDEKDKNTLVIVVIVGALCFAVVGAIVLFKKSRKRSHSRQSQLELEENVTMNL